MITIHNSVAADLDFSAYNNMSLKEFEKSLEQGKRYVVFGYVMSIIVYSFNSNSKIIVGKSKSDLFIKSFLPYTILSILLGWWSFYGFLYTLKVLYTNCMGGVDISPEIRTHIQNQDPRFQYGMI
jgi:hypothetical protein